LTAVKVKLQQARNYGKLHTVKHVKMRRSDNNIQTTYHAIKHLLLD